MNLEKSQSDLLSSLLQSSVNTSKDIAEISGQDKTTVKLIAVGLTLAVTGFLRSMNV